MKILRVTGTVYLFFAIVASLLLIPLNLLLLKDAKSKLANVVACLAGVILWFSPIIEMSRGRVTEMDMKWATGAFLLGIIHGFAFKYQHSVEFLIFRKAGNRALLFLPKAVVGILFLSAVFLLFWVVVVIIAWPYFEGDNSEHLFVIPIGLIITGIIGFLNTLMYSLFSRKNPPQETLDHVI